MYEYKIKLKYKIENCTQCPFRHERLIHEPVQAMDKLSGVITITRIQSVCPLRDEPITYNEQVEGYNSKCPLKGNMVNIQDNKREIL